MDEDQTYEQRRSNYTSEEIQQEMCETVESIAKMITSRDNRVDVIDEGEPVVIEYR